MGFFKIAPYENAQKETQVIKKNTRRSAPATERGHSFYGVRVHITNSLGIL